LTIDNFVVNHCSLSSFQIWGVAILDNFICDAGIQVTVKGVDCCLYG